MAVNTRTEYALRALLEITDSQQDAVSAQKICEHQELPKKYIERLLGNLKAAGLIISSAGAKGGYVLAKPAEDITLQQVLSAVDGGCSLNVFFTELGGRMRHLLSEYTLASIYESWKRGKK